VAVAADRANAGIDRPSVLLSRRTGGAQLAAPDAERASTKRKRPSEAEAALVAEREALVEQLYLRCPNAQCKAMLDPTPEACCAMQCLCCGKHFCFVCMRRFKSSKDVHTHALTVHGSVWPKVPIVKRGHYGVLATGVVAVLGRVTTERGAPFAAKLLGTCSHELKLAELPAQLAELERLADASDASAASQHGGGGSAASESASAFAAAVSAASVSVARAKRVKRAESVAATAAAAAAGATRAPPRAAASLVMAAKNQSWPAVTQLLSSYTGEKGADDVANAMPREKLLEEQEGWTVLDMAARNNEVSIVRRVVVHADARGCLRELLEHKVPGVERTPVFLAVESNNADIIAILLEAGADCCTQDHHQQTPLMAAAMRGYSAVGMLLLEHAAQCDDEARRALRDATAGEASADAARAAAQIRAAPSPPRRRSGRRAEPAKTMTGVSTKRSKVHGGAAAPGEAAPPIGGGGGGALRRMLTARQHEGWNPLSIASWKGREKVVEDIVYAFKTLSCREIDVGALPGHALPGPTIVAERVTSRAAVAQNGDALKHAAPALRADKEVVLAAVTQCGWALHFAAPALRADKEVALAAVVQNGRALEYAAPALRADKDVALAAVVQNGRALEYAASALQVDAEIVLAASDAAAAEARDTAATEARDARLALFLTEFVDDRDERSPGAGGINRTALHLAAEAGHAKVVRALLHHGADPRALDSGNRSALLVAASLGHEGPFFILLFAHLLFAHYSFFCLLISHARRRRVAADVRDPNVGARRGRGARRAGEDARHGVGGAAAEGRVDATPRRGVLKPLQGGAAASRLW
jgi:hypothetical protein